MASELDALTAAIIVIADARSAHDARTRATALVEEYKIKYPALDQLGLSLATPHSETDPPKEPYIRFVGLQLVEYYVLSRWNGLSDADKEAFKSAIVPQLFTVTLPVGAEQMYIYEKVAKIISDVAMREWPQRWTSLTDDLIAAAGMGAQHALVTLIVLRTLAENVQTFSDDLPTARKNDLVSAFMGFISMITLEYLDARVEALCATTGPISGQCVDIIRAGEIILVEPRSTHAHTRSHDQRQFGHSCVIRRVDAAVKCY